MLRIHLGNLYEFKNMDAHFTLSRSIFQARNVSSLAETVIYVATVDKFSDVLKTVLAWVAENRDEVGDIKMDNADCILHASLEDDKEQVIRNVRINEVSSSSQ